MVLESSVEEFVARFGAFAAQGTLYAQPEGSPLMEFAAGGRVLYLFDRTGPYAVRPGAGRVIVHGVLESMERLEDHDAREEELSIVSVSGLEGRGEVLEASRGFCVVRARLPILLGSFSARNDVQVGDWVAFRTLSPLHGFVVEAPGRL